MDTSFIEFIKQYGWGLFIVWWLYKELWPWVRDNYFPSLRVERTTRAQLIADRDQQQSERLANLEERQVTAFEQVAAAVAEMARSYVLTNERLGNIILTQQTMLQAMDSHDVRMTNAIARMEERTRPVEEEHGQANVKPSSQGQAQAPKETGQKRDRDQASKQG